MCKPGSACCGSGASSSGLGVAVVVLGTAGAMSLAATVASTIVTAALIIVFGAAAAVAVMLVVLLRRTRGVVTWPMRISPAPVPGNARPAAGRAALSGPSAGAAASPALSRPPAGTAARPAIPARQPLAIEAPMPAYVRAGLPTVLSGPATRWRAAGWPGSEPGGPAPEAVLADRAGLAAAEVTPGHDVPPDGRPAHAHYV